MKRFLSTALVLALLALCFSGCDRKTSTDDTAIDAQSGNFEPAATAITSQAEAVGDESLAAQTDAPSTAEVASEPLETDPVAVDTAVTEDAGDAPSTEAPAAEQPFATATPQPNTAISGYTEISGTGLGFKFSYPNGWNNIPARSTVCYVQPLENGTVYPARVAVTMKKLAHNCSAEKAQNELAEYIKLLMTQYDEKTFEVNKDLDTTTKFMGNQAISTTYLAYDGNQEIQGYVILTWFEKYVFCYHFLCAYEDYTAFDSAMRHMRDSVQAVQSDFEGD